MTLMYHACSSQIPSAFYRYGQCSDCREQNRCSIYGLGIWALAASPRHHDDRAAFTSYGYVAAATSLRAVVALLSCGLSTNLRCGAVHQTGDICTGCTVWKVRSGQSAKHNNLRPLNYIALYSAQG